MKVAEAAKRLEVSQGCVYQLIASGKLRCMRIGVKKGTIRIAESDLTEFIESARESAHPEEQLKFIKVR